MKKILFIACALVVTLYTFLFAATSRETRENNYFKVHQNIIGIGTIGIFLRPYGASFYLGDSISLGYEQANGKLEDGAGFATSNGNDSVIFNAGEDDADLKYSAVLARWFVANSFYLLLKGSQFEVDGNIEVKESSGSSFLSSSETVSYDVDMKTTLISLGVGNQWILANWFVIGADWFVYPVSRNTEYSYTVLENPDNHQDPEGLLEKGIDIFEVGAGLQIVTFYIGFSF